MPMEAVVCQPCESMGIGHRTDYFKCDLENAVSAKEQDIFFIDRATYQATKSPMNQKHGCVIVKNGKIISSCYNSQQDPFGHSVHAEVGAIIRAKKTLNTNKLKGCKLYVVRIGTRSMNFPLKYSKPCANCQKFIEKSGIETVFYSIAKF